MAIMMTIQVVYDGPDMAKIPSRLRTALLKQMGIFGRRSTGSGGYGLSAHLKRAGGYAPNSRAWQKAKDGKRIFYDTGAFRNSPTYQIVPSGDGVGVEVGFPLPSQHVSSDNRSAITVQDIANILTTGAEWEPTTAQRRAFWRRVRMKDPDFARNAANERLKGANTKLMWSIPPRDFLTKHFESIHVRALFDQCIRLSVEQAYRAAHVRRRLA